MRPAVSKPQNVVRWSGLNVLRRFGPKMFLLWLYYRIKVGPGVTVGWAMDEKDLSSTGRTEISS